MPHRLDGAFARAIAWIRLPFDRRNPEALCTVHGWRMRNNRRLVIVACSVSLSTGLAVAGVSAIVAAGVQSAAMGWFMWSLAIRWPFDLQTGGCFPACTCGRSDRILRAQARDMDRRVQHLKHMTGRHYNG